MTENHSSSSRDRTTPEKQRVIEDLAAKGSAFAKYRDFHVGTPGVAAFLRYELTIVLVSGLRGAAGYFLRKTLFPGLFRSVGRGVNFGRNLILRCPARIELGDDIAIDDNCTLDARGVTEGDRFKIGSGSLIARDTVLLVKSGSLRIGRNCSIGTHCFLGATNDIELGDDVLVAGHCFIGGGRYQTALGAGPMVAQGLVSKGATVIGNDVWIGAGVRILDGARVGDGAIVGAGAVVTGEVAPESIVGGVPARKIGRRR